MASALCSTSALAGRKVSVRTVAPRAQRQAVRTCALFGENKAAKAAAAGLAAAVLLNVTPANAGVVMVEKKLKNALVDDTPTLSVEEKKAAKEAKKAAAKEAPAAPAAKAEKSNEEKKAEYRAPESGSALPFILPAALAVLGGGGFALTKLDPEFAALLENSTVPKSDTEGPGFEVALKEGNVGAGTKVLAKPAKKKGRFF